MMLYFQAQHQQCILLHEVNCQQIYPIIVLLFSPLHDEEQLKFT